MELAKTIAFATIVAFAADMFLVGLFGLHGVSKFVCTFIVAMLAVSYVEGQRR